MKCSWLLLVAAALAFGPAASAAASLGRKEQTRRRLPLRGNQPCVGCYTLLSAPLLPEDRPQAFENATLALLVEPSRRPPPHPALRTSGIEESTLSDPALGSLDLRLNTKSNTREEKRAGPGQRRGRQRAGTRPVCRGCYSGLMIVAPPGNHTGMQESHSESAWESSEED